MPLMATHLVASMDRLVGIAAVKPSHVASSGAIAVPHETSLLVASTLRVASTDQLVDVPAGKLAHVTSDDAASPTPPHVALWGYRRFRKEETT